MKIDSGFCILSCRLLPVVYEHQGQCSEHNHNTWAPNCSTPLFWMLMLPIDSWAFMTRTQWSACTCCDEWHHENSGFQECDTVSVWVIPYVLKDSVAFIFKGQALQEALLHCLTLEEGITVLQNIRNHSPRGRASHPRITRSSPTVLWESHVSHSTKYCVMSKTKSVLFVVHNIVLYFQMRLWKKVRWQHRVIRMTKMMMPLLAAMFVMPIFQSAMRVGRGLTMESPHLITLVLPCSPYSSASQWKAGPTSCTG